MNANLELYRIFCEVVKYKNISKAAENIYISQSAVTQSIQKLEKILGGKLFFRNKNGVELTEEGKNLYEYIGDSIEKMNNAENLFSQYINLEKGIIRICGGKFLVNKYVMPSLVEFIKDYPNIDIRISRATTQESLKKLSLPHVKVIRQNQLQEINANDLTIGNLVCIEAGDIISGDGHLLEANHLQVNESHLTGEVESIDKSVEIIKEKTILAKQKKHCFFW